MGAHVGPPRAHTTGRTHSLAFRAATAFFGHFGVEWNVLDLDDRELAQLSDVVALHKRFRPLLHSGVTRRIDHPNPAVIAHSVVRADQREALVSYALVGSPRSLMCEPVRVVGLLDDVRYRVDVLPIAGGLRGAVRRQPVWITDGLVATGRQLAALGVQPPVLHPESAMVVHIRAEGEPV